MQMMHNWSVLPMTVMTNIHLFQDGADSASLAVVVGGMLAIRVLLLVSCLMALEVCTSVTSCKQPFLNYHSGVSIYAYLGAFNNDQTTAVLHDEQLKRHPLAKSNLRKVFGSFIWHLSESKNACLK